MIIDTLDTNWDIVIIGGGITGAGILREAARSGLKVLLLEQNDFAWGTSSRSSKMVHGGLRYLKEGRFALTRESVRERERLLEEAPFLVEPLDFLFPVYKGRSPRKHSLRIGLSLYDFMAFKKRHTFLPGDRFVQDEPKVETKKLKGGFRFMDAQVDDARLVLRVIYEAECAGARALNYVTVKEIIRDANGNVSGILVMDTETGETREISTNAVINATGAWAENLHPSPHKKRHIRPLRGSHLFFPYGKLPVSRAVSLVHPYDLRPIFIIPWEGAVLVGTTDLDHEADLAVEPSISKEEVSYLLTGVQTAFPRIELTPEDCLASSAGVRPVLSKGKLSPAQESREHVIWVDKGLVTITGGKLTTFRKLAWTALKAIKPFVAAKLIGKGKPVFSPLPDNLKNGSVPDPFYVNRLYGRYGSRAKNLIKDAAPDQLTAIPETFSLWAELPFTAANENIRHLSDLLLRRLRIGLLLPEGGRVYLDRIQKMVAPVLPWDDQKWEAEKALYLDNWRKNYSVPSFT